MNLGKLIKNTKRASQPGKKFKRELWQNLDSRFDAMYPVTLGLAPRKAAVIACAVLIILGIGSGAYAYESPNVVEGHFLNPLKQGIENLEGKLKFSAEQKAKWHLKMQERRLAEGEFFVQKKEFNKKLFEKGLQEMGQGFDEMKNIAEPDKREQMFKKFSEMEQAKIKMLQQIKPRLAEGSQQMIDRIIVQHTQTMQARVNALEAEQQEFFKPLKLRRFMIVRPMIEPANTLATSSDIILSADKIPWGEDNIEIRLINY